MNPRQRNEAMMRAFRDARLSGLQNHQQALGVIAGAARAAIAGGPQAVQQFMAQQGFPQDGAWCGEFAAAVIHSMGGTPPQNPEVASNWRNYGQPLNHPVPGAIAVRIGRSSSSPGNRVGTGNTGSHVTFVSQVNPDGTFTGVGGNQGATNRSPTTPARYPISGYEFRSPSNVFSDTNRAQPVNLGGSQFQPPPPIDVPTPGQSDVAQSEQVAPPLPRLPWNQSPQESPTPVPTPVPQPDPGQLSGPSVTGSEPVGPTQSGTPPAVVSAGPTVEVTQPSPAPDFQSSYQNFWNPEGTSAQSVDYIPDFASINAPSANEGFNQAANDFWGGTTSTYGGGDIFGSLEGNAQIQIPDTSFSQNMQGFNGQVVPESGQPLIGFNDAANNFWNNTGTVSGQGTAEVGSGGSADQGGQAASGTGETVSADGSAAVGVSEPDYTPYTDFNEMAGGLTGNETAISDYWNAYNQGAGQYGDGNFGIGYDQQGNPYAYNYGGDQNAGSSQFADTPALPEVPPPMAESQSFPQYQVGTYVDPVTGQAYQVSQAANGGSIVTPTDQYFNSASGPNWTPGSGYVGSGGNNLSSLGGGIIGGVGGWGQSGSNFGGGMSTGVMNAYGGFQNSSQVGMSMHPGDSGDAQGSGGGINSASMLNTFKLDAPSPSGAYLIKAAKWGSGG